MFQKLVTSKSKQEILDDLLCAVQSKADPSDQLEPAIVVITTLSEEAFNRANKEAEPGVDNVPYSYLQPDVKSLQLKESAADLAMQNRKAKIPQTQTELDASKLHQATRTIFQRSIIEKLDAIVEEKQAVFVTQAKNRVKENLMEADNHNVMLKLDCLMLETDISEVRKQRSEFYQSVQTEKNRRVKEASTLQGLVVRVEQLEKENGELVQSNNELITERDRLLCAREDQQDELNRLGKCLEDLAKCNHTKDMLLKDIQEKKARRKGWRKLTC